jgi:hypothetical protein
MAHLLVDSPADRLAYALADETCENYGDYQEAGYGWSRSSMREWCDYWLEDDDADLDSITPADEATIAAAIERAIEICEERLSCLL